MTYQLYGEKGILISWPQLIEDAILQDMVSVKKTIINVDKNELLDVTNGYNSLLLLYKEQFNFDRKIAQLKQTITSRKHNKVSLGINTWIIPVCYHKSFAMDLADLAVLKGKTEEQLITLHSQPNYKVYCKGFLPGFMYLGGLDSQLYTPRKSVPRLRVPKNSVAIGGKQTGIYPCESPGGWHIIGRTPLTLFDVNSEQITPIIIGDTIRFKEISLDEYLAMEFQKIKLIPSVE